MPSALLSAKSAFHLSGIALAAILVTGCHAHHVSRVDLLISRGRVVDPVACTSAAADVAVDHGIIVAVGSGLARYYDAGRTIDARGQYLIPGLADMHTHFGTGILPDDEDDTRQVLARLLYYGVTTTLNLGSFQAWPGKIDALRRQMKSGRIQGPRLLAAGALITVPGSHPTTTIYSPALQAKIAAIVAHAPAHGPIDLAPATRRATTIVRTPADMRAEVHRLGDWGANVIKIVVESGPDPFGNNHPQMPSALIAAAVRIAHGYHIPVLCHISSVDELEACLDNGADAAAHAALSEHGYPPGIEAKMAKAGMALIPTASLYDGWVRYPADPGLLDAPFLRETLTPAEATKARQMIASLPPKPMFSQRELSNLRTHLKKAEDAGVLIVAGTDTGNPFRFPGYALHEELAFYQSSGLSQCQALATRQ